VKFFETQCAIIVNQRTSIWQLIFVHLCQPTDYQNYSAAHSKHSLHNHLHVISNRILYKI